MNQYKPIPIGVEDFKRLVDDGYYFVDKTLFIKEILDRKGAVNLFTRPRRFGKTLNISMLQRFFEKTDEDNSYL
ncbi:MAG: AAA family ATPase, partial [Ruminococcus sp.]|nr:AAA family ATPase [Ruminococcus sp.]